jgi:integrase
MPTLNLTDLSVRKLKPGATQITYWDKLHGFGVRVGANRKTWLVMRGKTRARTTIGHYPDLGLADARKKAKGLLGETVEERSRLTFSDALEKFFTLHCAPNLKANSRQEVERSLRRHFLPVFASKKLDKVTDRDVGDILDAMVATPSEANHAFKDIRTFFRWCVRPPRRYIQHSPIEGMRMPFVTVSRKRVLTPTELLSVWRAADRAGYPFGTIVKLLILTGQRWCEIVSLRTDYINKKDQTITLPETKNGRIHTFPYNGMVASILDTLPRWNSTNLLFPGRDPETPWNGAGKAKFYMEWRPPIRPWTLHDLRRTFATIHPSLGTPPHVIERLLNHRMGSLQTEGVISDVAEIYNRYQYLPEMGAAVEKYERHIEALVGC